MSSILVLGGTGEMGSVAVTDLAQRTDHDIAIADPRVEDARALLRRLGRPEQVYRLDVSDDTRLVEVMAGHDLVLNTTLMRYTLAVTDAAIAARVHLVDLGSYYDDTLAQLERNAAAEEAGCRIVPGCGVAPGLTNVLAALGAGDLDHVTGVRMYSYITHPMYTSPGIVVTRFDASTGRSVILRDGSLVERPSFGDHETIEFAEPYGAQQVHLVPHPEVVTLPRYLDGVRDVVFKVGYPAEENNRIATLLSLGFDSDEPFDVDGHSISPRRFAAAYIGRRGLAPTERSANVKKVLVDGVAGGLDTTVRYDFAVENSGRSASATITGTVAAIAADMVTAPSAPGVRAPESALDPNDFLDRLAERGLEVSASKATE
ncbi:MAG: hypothetical protein GEV07_21675 [Streptosporangiales bacterium]|nr:hypothetical protein [Streptosporangiales bacterium]